MQLLKAGESFGVQAIGRNVKNKSVLPLIERIENGSTKKNI